jgi:class 3 adenylate cyclase
MDTEQLAAVALGNRVDRSFGFIDLCGFTDFIESRGDEAGVAELQYLRASVREVAPLFGVRVDKWLGDGAMLVGVDNQPLVAAVVAVQERHRGHGELPVRAGVASGEVLLLEGDDYTGRAVNLAARLCDMAAQGEILAAIDGLHLPTWVHPSAERSVEVKGLSGPVAVVSLVPDPSAVEPAAPRALTSLVEGLARPVRSLRPPRR